MSAAIPNGVIALQAVGLRPAEISAPPDRLYLQSPERYEFVDITDLSKRYVISLQTGLYIPFSGSGGAGSTTFAALTDDPKANALLNAQLLAKLNNAIGWDPSTNTAPTLASGTALSGAYAGINSVVNTRAGTTTLGTAIDGYTTTKQGDVWIYGFGGTSTWTVFAIIPPIATTDLTDAHVLAEQTTNAQTGTTYSLALTDAGKNVDMNNASANVLTIPLNANVAFPIGTVVTVTQAGAGVTTVSPASGVTVTKPAARALAISAQTETAFLYKIGTDAWRVYCN